MTIKNLSRHVDVRTDLEDQKVKISECQHCYIYIDNLVKSLYITNVRDCTIFVGGCENIGTLEKCENLNVTLVTNFLRVGNCIDTCV